MQSQERGSESPSFAATSVLAGDAEQPLANSRLPLLAILGVTLVLQIVAWSLQHGYPIADVVEYMERARHWVLGASVGGDDTIRSVAFPALFAPLFALQRWLGFEDPRWIMPAAQMIQMSIGLGLVWAVARLGARVGGGRVGLAAALVAACNPIFLIHSVWPLADVAAALCVALGLEAFVARHSARREFAGGLWLGLAFLFAYKTLPVIALVGLWCLARDRFRHRSSWLGLAGGLALAVALQVALDRWVYGEWGSTVWRYLVDNTGSTLTTALARLGFTDAARAIYTMQSSLRDFPVSPTDIETKQLLSRAWYLEHLTEFLSLPVLALGACGLFRVARARLGAGALLVVLAVAHAMVTSMKGDKSFRLWLPILPALAVLAGLGFDALRGERAERWRAGAAATLLAAVVVLAPWDLQRLTPRRYGVFWDAMDFVNDVSASHPLKSGRHPRFASSFFWGPYLRNVPQVELIRVWPPLDYFARLGPGAKKSVQSQLDGLDGLIVHFALVANQPELARMLDARFSVLAAFHEPASDDAPVVLYVLARPRSGLPGRRLFETEHVEDPVAYRGAHGFGEPTRFVATAGNTREVLTLLGVECTPLPGAGARQLVYHWLAETDLTHEYRAWTRLRRGAAPVHASDARTQVWRLLPAESRTRGTVLREARLLLADESEAAAADVDLWVAVEHLPTDGAGVRATAESAAESAARDAEGFVRVASLPNSPAD